jgi:hypothetical protein
MFWEKMIAIFFVGLGTQAFGAKENGPIDAETLCSRLQIMEETLVFDLSGKRITHSYREERKPRASISNGAEKKTDGVVCRRGSSSGHSSSAFTGSVFFHHEWTVNKDGTISVTYDQGSEFVGHGRDAKLKDSMGSKTVDVKDFQSVSWVSPFHKAERVVIRLTPMLTEQVSTRDIGAFPLFLSGATVFDGTGKLWTANLTAFGDYIGVLTVQGGVLVSLQPFEQGKIIGEARGREIRFSLADGTSVLIKSDDVILPGDLSTKVYVMYDPSLKAKNFGSQSVSSGKDPEDILQRLKKHAI